MSDVDKPEFWHYLYENDQFPWDLGNPTPVFQRLVAEGSLPPGRMIVLGAGLGHDARHFARHGFEVTAVDFADAAVQGMHDLADPAAPVIIVQADFFHLSTVYPQTFDYVLDYTSFCAISPARRGEYADLVHDLLRENGRYLLLAFPIGKRPGGPPFVVQPDAIIALFGERPFVLIHRESPSDSVPSRKGYEELLILQKVPAPFQNNG
jgi:methyl halide transferase